MQKGNLAYAVLGLVSQEGDGIHCYRLTGQCEALHDDFWEVNYGRVSRVLDTLEQAGDLSSFQESQAGKPNRKVYRITGRGKQDLDDWLLEPISDTPRPLRDELSLKLLFLGLDRLEEVARLIVQQRSILLSKLARVTRRRQQLSTAGMETEVVGIVMDGAEMRVRADLAWLEHIERMLLRRS